MIEIRPFADSLLEPAVEFLGSAGHHMHEMYYSFVIGEPAFPSWLAVEDGRIVGAVEGDIESEWDSIAKRYPGPQARVFSIAVDPAYRGHGVGRDLIGAFASYAHGKSRSYIWAMLLVDEHLARRQAFFDRCGLTDHYDSPDDPNQGGELVDVIEACAGARPAQPACQT